jgi:hypothetical protein
MEEEEEEGVGACICTRGCGGWRVFDGRKGCFFVFVGGEGGSRGGWAAVVHRLSRSQHSRLENA